MPTLIPQVISDNMPSIESLLVLSRKALGVSQKTEVMPADQPTLEQLEAVETARRKTWLNRLEGATFWGGALCLYSGEVSSALIYAIAWRFSQQAADFAYTHRQEAVAIGTYFAKPIIKGAKDIIENISKADTKPETTPETPLKKAM